MVHMQIGKRKFTPKQLKRVLRKMAVKDAMRTHKMIDAVSQLSPVDEYRIRCRAIREVDSSGSDLGICKSVNRLASICDLAYKYTCQFLETIVV